MDVSEPTCTFETVYKTYCCSYDRLIDIYLENCAKEVTTLLLTVKKLKDLLFFSIKSLKQYQNKETDRCKNTIEFACDVVKKSMSITENVIPFIKDEPLHRSFTKPTYPIVYGLVI